MAPVSAHMEPESPMLDPRPLPGEHWNPNKHTIALPTDAYGYVKITVLPTQKYFVKCGNTDLKIFRKVESQEEES